MRSSLLFLAAIGWMFVLQAQPTTPSIEAPAGARLLLTAMGDGVQIYSCREGHWVLKAPDAKLLDGTGRVIGSHFAGPTWRLKDGSEVKGTAVANQAAPDGTSVAWLLVQAVAGSASGKLADVGYIRRTETRGGAAPKTACTGGELSVPYRAKYSFYVAKPAQE